MNRSTLPYATITTVTLHPAVDEIMVVDGLVPGALNRVLSRDPCAGGKGLNVSTMLACHGIPTVATGFLGTDNAAIFEQHIRQSGIHDEFIRVPGETRTCYKLIDSKSGITTEINGCGPHVSPKDLATLITRLEHILKPGDWIVFSGSLPPGCDLPDFRRMLVSAQSTGAHVAVDVSGPGLTAAIEAGVELIKPNREELAAAYQLDGKNTAELVECAKHIQQNHVKHVILSLGPDGACFAAPDGFPTTKAPPIGTVCNTVGAGDSMLAGYLAGIAHGMNAMDRARLANAFAWSALENRRLSLPPEETLRKRMEQIPIR